MVNTKEKKIVLAKKKKKNEEDIKRNQMEILAL